MSGKKTARDATRFTPTGVWAHTKPGGRSTTLQFAEPAPKNETPQQKVKRLREAANKAKLAQVTNWDVAYLYGRNFADAAHRLTVYGIIFATGCFGVLAVFSIGDMIVYNRRKRAIFFEQQEKEQARILAIARTAVLEGHATPAQAALVEGIREEEEAMAQKKAERGVSSRLLWWLHGEWNEDKKLKEERQKTFLELQREQAAKDQGLGITQAVQNARANGSGQPAVGAAGVVGGPLDQEAAKTAEVAKKGWLGWAFGGSKKDD
ncbi:cytochrome oxidase c assembly-domain-containing protein [Clohesyomyces aquaticus]|uniref:Cytochrome oxidase c assembly-domain-containing protein n=1 Tax=Clohesyomyces aquaticus TaxID=1231657 RepID=A0A1Y1ZWX8_9PLEO|nr:cytochrome oxidase c assembly-domain-containing protein [Clohesyomyces aquaticus]